MGPELVSKNECAMEIAFVVVDVVVVRTHEPWEVASAETHRDPLSAVWPSLQLKFHDSGITVTNWDRVR